MSENAGNLCDCGEDKMCSLACCPCSLDIDKIKAFLDNPKFICSVCAHVANREENLCKPVSLH